MYFFFLFFFFLVVGLVHITVDVGDLIANGPLHVPQFQRLFCFQFDLFSLVDREAARERKEKKGAREEREGRRKSARGERAR